MRYIWETGKARRVMHVQAHTVTGEPLMAALCGIDHQFNRSINAPWGLGRKICKNCRRESTEDKR